MRLPIFIVAILLITITHSCISSAQSPKTETTTKAPKATLNHIALYVVDLKISTNFYNNIIGLDTIPEPFHDGRHTWFGVGKQGHLHIISGAKAATTHDKNTHLCFSVPSVNEFIPNLTKNNITYENWAGQPNTVTNRVDGVKQIYFKDPDGYWIEINDAKE